MPCNLFQIFKIFDLVFVRLDLLGFVLLVLDLLLLIEDFGILFVFQALLYSCCVSFWKDGWGHFYMVLFAWAYFFLLQKNDFRKNSIFL